MRIIFQINSILIILIAVAICCYILPLASFAANEPPKTAQVDIKIDDLVTYRLKTGNDVRFLLSEDGGNTFSSSKIRAQKSKMPFLLADKNVINAFWVEKNLIMRSSSDDLGKTWTDPMLFFAFSSVSSDAVAYCVKSIKDNIFIISWIFEDKIFVAKTFNAGKTWTDEISQSTSFDNPINIFSIVIDSSGINVIVNDHTFTFFNSPIGYLQIKTPDGIITNDAYPVIEFTCSTDPGIENAAYSIDVCSDKNFVEGRFISYPVASFKFKMTDKMNNGTTYYRISAFDGIRTVYSDIKSIIVDTLPPLLLKASFVRKGNEIELKDKTVEAIPCNDCKIKFVFNKDMNSNSNINCSLESVPAGTNYKITSLIWSDSKTLVLSIDNPKDFKEMAYKIKLSGISDIAGNDLSYYGDIRIIVDYSPPYLKVNYPAESTVKTQNISLYGNVEPGAKLLISGQPVSSDAKGLFTVMPSLVPGQNKITCEASDLSGNTSYEEKILYFEQQTPQITITKPSAQDWFKHGTTVAVEANVSDSGNDIDDETEGIIFVNGKTVESNVFYDLSQQRLSGFINLPANLCHGKNQLAFCISDNKGNTGVASCETNIDSIAPKVSSNVVGNIIYSNRTDRIDIPIEDLGSGPDLDACQIKVYFDSATVEGRFFTDRSSLSLCFLPASGFKETVYNIELCLKDFCANIAVQNITLVIDQKAPQIDIISDIPSETYCNKLDIAGFVNKKNVKDITFVSNSKNNFSAPVTNGKFSTCIPLNVGKNYIEIKAVDLAGNQTNKSICLTQTQPPDHLIFNFDGKNIKDGDFVNPSPVIKVVDDTGNGIAGAVVSIDDIPVASYEAGSGLVTLSTIVNGNHNLKAELPGKTYSVSFVVENNAKVSNVIPCPNPFNPDNTNLTITYNTSKPCNVQFYIVDNKGATVWKGNTTSVTGYNSFIWNGKQGDGENASNGVYIICIVAKDTSGASYTSKGKIILLH